ncbi:hypothetical protein BAU15_04895 [Enterococcus sp. JM4C]|uniref:hypothetical protein n=1 Tax=Candidatus Enterococcus huntleyi TaxID=1857217 RepID=UPI0013797C6E|nr:hypothetical protein [Enterococcus sp. JM4C]KAF1295095.1 hypothetical protein BAU15_04895 [Enterococcus sp. JM4C]
MTWLDYDSEILNTMKNFKLEEIAEGIDELERKIGRTLFGETFDERLEILYILKRQSEYKNVCSEVRDVKEEIFKELLKQSDERTARVKAFSIWVGYQNQLLGAEFVRDNLRLELNKLKQTEVTNL